MPNYQNSKIYSIRSMSRPELMYIGSTTRKLSERFGEHKKIKPNDCNSKQIINIGDAYIELLEDFPCETKEQLLKREGELIRSNNCVNKNIAGRTHKEYIEDNKEHIAKWQKEYGKQWYLKNKEYITKLQKEYQIKHKEHIKNVMKEYNIKHKDAIKIKKREYQIKHKEHIKNVMKEYRDATKDMRTCICGKKYNYGRKDARDYHYNSNHHIEFVLGLPFFH